MTSGHGDKQVRHCHHCGRQVGDTVHTRTSYRVDFYSLHTGDVEPVRLAHGDDGETILVQRLVRPYDIFSCADCYARPAVREERDRLFRPEVYAAVAANADDPAAAAKPG